MQADQFEEEREACRLDPNARMPDPYLYIEVSRSNIVNDTLAAIQRADAGALTKGLKILFKGEEAEDAGGVSREFFYLLCNDAFSPDYGLFRRIEGGKYWFRSDALQAPIYYNLLGTIVALALYNSIVLPIRFPRILYKKLCGHALGPGDLHEIAPDVAESFEALRQMRSDGENVVDCGLTFSVTLERLDSGVPISPLKPGGEAIAVTNTNLDEYIELYSDYLMNGSIKNAYRLFERGFRKVTQRDVVLFRMFQYDELDLIVSGVDVLDWTQLRLNARYSNGYNAESPVVQWFWEVFDEMTDEQKRWLLRFATGTDRTPVTGLSDVRLIIQRSGDTEKLPVAHTCFSIFGLPDYPSKEVLKEKVLIAIENNEGFGII
jgi:ubiquitin-protein ligase E3 A